MSSLDLKIINFFKKASKRLKLNLFLNDFVIGLIITLIVSSIPSLMSLVVPIYKIKVIYISILLIGVCISFIYSMIRLPNKEKQALIIDSKGLDERLSTALESIGKEKRVYSLQKEDTARFIESFNIKEKIPIIIEKKKVIMVISLVVISSLGMFIKTEAKTLAKEIEITKKFEKETLNKIEEQKKVIQKIDKLSEDEKKKIIEVLEKTEKEITTAKTEKDIEKSLERLDKKLEKEAKDPSLSKEKQEILKNVQKDISPKGKEERKEKANKDLNKLADKFSEDKFMEDLSKQLADKNKEGIDKALKDIKSSVSSLGDLEKSQISRSLKEASLNIDDEDLKEALRDISKDVKEGNISDENEKKTSEALKSLVDETEGTASKGDNKGEKKEQSGEGKEKGQGEDVGEGQGEGKSNGEGQGSEKGKGEGFNKGSKNGINKTDTSTPLNKEEVFIPNRNEGNDENLTGNKNNNSSSQTVDSDKGIEKRGESINYDKVIGDYTKEAYDSVNNLTIPEALKDIIKSYFEGLQ
ncbi:hypothetical protein [Clostridium algidicarnis]|uniref:Uncharacterized protein n=1 Tax=Clostridium algidicarnis DSM 15099 TaxID=1121295 RepID=A0A2S6FZE5_9CLOT|nr:hypothetical protein [Clostridium algidicarnis]MBB6631554.1 hypothetical protein [Clostridium algidicarnis]PPK49000.1 hypothetical protein BD821_103128 [Clostridium algidicarnis DSM 15099]